MNDNLKIDYTKFHLPNGIKCILYRRSEIHSVNIQVEIGVGALDEDKNTNGISHFIEHVAAGDGTEAFPSWDKLADYINEYSGSTNAYTSYENTEYYGTFPHQYLDQALYYFSQQVFFPLIREEDVDKERTIILDEKKGHEDTVESKIYKNIKRNRFVTAETPYSFDIIGEEDNLKRFKAQDLRDFYSTHYVPNNINIFIVGNIDIEEAKKLLEKHFSDALKNKSFSGAPDRKFKKDYPEYSNFRINADRKLDIDQYYLTVTFPAFEFALTDIEERYKLGFIKSITSSSQFPKSVLWKRLREELNLVYGVYAYTNNMFSRNFMAIETSFKKEYLETVMKEIYEGLNKVKGKEISDEVFNARKKKIIDTQLMELDDPQNILNWIRAYEDEIQEHGKGMTLQDYLAYVQAAKFDDIIAASNKIYDWSRANIGIVTQDDPKEIEAKVGEMWKKIVN